MIDILVSGNLAFTLPLLAVGISVLVTATVSAVRQWQEQEGRAFLTRLVFHLGLFGFVFGLFSQAVSLYQMMRAIERVGDVSPALVAGGLKVSLICPIFGSGIFVVALMLWFGLRVQVPASAFS